jgi:hypothetical protein
MAAKEKLSKARQVASTARHSPEVAQRMKRKMPISALGDVAVLFPRDLHKLVLFLGKVYAARDREANARNTGVTTGPSRPTLHGLAAHCARVTDIDLRRIERMLVKAGFDLGALIEFDSADSANATG